MSIMGMVGAILIYIGAALLMAVIKGFVLSKLWLWFIIPVFAVRAITILEATGLMLVYTFINGIKTIDEEMQAKEFSHVKRDMGLVWDVFGTSVVVLAVGYLLHMIMRLL